MDEKAVITKSYRRQLMLFALMILFFSLYFLYDGYIGYPHDRMIAQEYAQFREEGRLSEWGAHARAKGWPDDSEGEPTNHSDSSVFTQKLIGYGLLPIGLLFAYSLVRSFSRWMRLENDGIATSWGQRMAFDSVKQLKKNRWKTKGIAVAYYDDGSGSKKLVLDDFKFTRHLIGQMLLATEAHLAPDQIVGGPPEAPEATEGDKDKENKDKEETQQPSTDS